MEESFKLQTTMSPKLLYNKVHIKKPTKLALRKNIRRSSCYDKPPAAVALINKKNTLKLDLSSDTEFVSAESNTDNSFAMFADLSVIPKDNTMKAMNSTFVEGRRTMFHEMFKTTGTDNKKFNSNEARDDMDNIQTLTKETKTSDAISEDVISKVIKNQSKSRNNEDMIASNKNNIIEQSIKHDEDVLQISDSASDRSIIEASISSEKDTEEVRKVLVLPYLSTKARENEILRTGPKKKIAEKINHVHKAVCQTDVKKLKPQKSCNERHGIKLYFNESESNSEDEQISKKHFRRIVNPKGNFKKNKDIEIVTYNPKKTLVNKFLEIKMKLMNEPQSLSDSDNDLMTKKINRKIITPNTDGVLITKAKDLQDENIVDKKIKIFPGDLPKQLINECNANLIDPEIIYITDSDDEELISTKNSRKSTNRIEMSDNIFQKSDISNNDEIIKSNNVEDEHQKDNLDEVRKLLDDVYGSSWREKEHEILRTEPRKMVSTKMHDVIKSANHTDIKKLESNKENVGKSSKLNLFNGEKNTKVYSESPLPSVPTTLKKVGRRKLFASVESEDDDFDGDSAPVLNQKSSTSNSQTSACKSRDVLRNSSKKVTVKSTAKYRQVVGDSDSESESVKSFGLGDSDWESPPDYLPKFIKNNLPVNSVQKKQKSFLESLSKNVQIFEAHPTARIFRNDFKKHKDELIARLFKLFNEEVFDTVIPINTSIEWNSRLRGTAGYCKNKSVTHRDKNIVRTVHISLSSKVVDSPERLRDTLIHEMCHAVNWIVDGQRGHGPSWRIWTEKARNIFPELAPMGTCHNYSIATKYTYRCTKCGYSFGRHSKSISVEEKCCGYCKGKLELLVNTVSKTGVAKSAPVLATPTRNPTPFALFVKDNYKKCKTPDLKHGDVMRLLSKQFSSLKVDKKLNVD